MSRETAKASPRSIRKDDLDTVIKASKLSDG